MKEFWVKSNGCWVTLHNELTKDGEPTESGMKALIIPIEYSAWLRLTGVELNKGEFKRIGIKELKGGGVIPESRQYRSS